MHICIYTLHNKYANESPKSISYETVKKNLYVDQCPTYIFHVSLNFKKNQFFAILRMVITLSGCCYLMVTVANSNHDIHSSVIYSNLCQFDTNRFKINHKGINYIIIWYQVLFPVLIVQNLCLGPHYLLIGDTWELAIWRSVVVVVFICRNAKKKCSCDVWPGEEACVVWREVSY